MSSNNESSSDISESETDDYEVQAYSKLKEEEHTVRNPDGTYRCPFRSDTAKQDYGYDEILHHASDMGTSNSGAKLKADHLALSKYLKTDVEQLMDLDDADDSTNCLKTDVEQHMDLNDADGSMVLPAQANGAELEPVAEATEDGSNKVPFSPASDSEDDSSDISESELDDYELQAYLKLKEGKHKVKNPDGTYRCPFCPDRKKKDYRHSEILQHATGIGASKRVAKVKGNHLALVKYLKIDAQHSASGSSIQAEVAELELPLESLKDGKLVFPWMGVLVNVPREWKEGRFVCSSGTKLREQLFRFNPLKVIPLWNFRGYTGSAIVEFRKDWLGFEDARAFQNHFKSQHHGKNDWDKKGSKDEGLYGWVARSDDYSSAGPIGDHLSKKGDLKTVAEITEEEKRKEQTLVNDLSSQIDAKNKHKQELESRLKDSDERFKQLCNEREAVLQNFSEAMQKHRGLVIANSHQVYDENSALRQQLEAKMREHEERRQQLDALQSQNEPETNRFADEKEKNSRVCTSLEMATLLQQKAEENVNKLVEGQKKERHDAWERQLQSRNKLVSIQNLELHVKILKGHIKRMKHMGGEDDSQYKKRIDELSTELAERMEELEDMESLNQTLIIKEKRNNEELQEGHKELVKGLLELATDKNIIGVKKMGEIDMKAFQKACKKRFMAQAEDDIRSVELYSHWEHEIQNPEWYPFRTIVAKDGKRKVVVEDDEKLIKLREELGPEAYNVVTTALLELNEYNPHSRLIVPFLWNFREQREASIIETTRYVLKQWVKTRSS